MHIQHVRNPPRKLASLDCSGLDRRKEAQGEGLAMVEFGSTQAEEWKTALAAYAERLESVGNAKLVELDEFYRVELPRRLTGRTPQAHITRDELAKIMEWKLSRGKWRPRLLNFVLSLADEDVQAASQKAFTALPDLKESIQQLSTLKGIGPATASAVLAAYAPSIAPFMSDEGMVAALGNVKDYTLKTYLIFTEKLQNKAQDLQKSGDLELEDFTASDVERALWSAAAATMPKKSSKTTAKSAGVPGAGTTKRKRR